MCVCVYIYTRLITGQPARLANGGKGCSRKRSGGRWGARKSIDTDGNVAIVASFRSPGYRPPGTKRGLLDGMGLWDHRESDSFRGESLSCIRLSVMAIPNFLPAEYFPTARPSRTDFLFPRYRLSIRRQFNPDSVLSEVVSLSISVRSTVVIIARGGGGRHICIPASRGMWRGNDARVSYSTSNSTGVVSFRQISPTTTTLITPAACIRFILPSIRNYESSLHFFHVPRFFSRRFTSCLALDPRSRFAASTERSLP